MTHAAAETALHSPPILVGRPGDKELTDDLLRPLHVRSRAWTVAFAGSGAGTLLFFGCILYTFAVGIGAWGNNIPVAWGFAIINFVWWIGIGHAGTFISAFLLLLEQPWRASVNRIAEAMTLFAVVQAGLYPVLHLGRPWFFYYLIPYPSTLGVWPNFRSALPWDMAAVATYGTVSLLFWYTGLVPDLAVARDRSDGLLRRRIYGLFALGWTGSQRDWNRHRMAYGLMAALAAPLVISVHSIVSSDFAITHVPGWHATIFPPYFVIGALYSGFAMVLTLIAPVRSLFGLHAVITRKHLDSLARLMLTMGLLITGCYVIEFFNAWYSGAAFERYLHFDFQPTGAYGMAFWGMLACNCLAPHVLWSSRVRGSAWALFVVSLVIQLGMWLERFVIVVTSLSRDFLPSAWGLYQPTWIDLGLFFGSVSFFAFLFLAFLRFVPPVPIAELKELRCELEDEES